MPNELTKLLLDDDDTEIETKKSPKEIKRAPFEKPGIILESIVGCNAEVVMGGMLMELNFCEGINPAEILEFLKTLDPNVQVRDAFPVRGNYQAKETKLARAVSILTKISGDKKFVTLVCETADDEIQVGVGQKKVDSFLDELLLLENLSARNRKKLEKSMVEKTEEVFTLKESEAFGVKYWSTDDGKHFVDSITAEVPEIKTKEEGKEEDE